jgi:hypothetical protein
VTGEFARLMQGGEALEPDETVTVGEKDWLIQYRKPRGGKVNQKNIEKFSDFIDQHLAVKSLFVRS